jgi:hypothetical protein
MKMTDISRRNFLKLSGVSALTMALANLDLQLLDPIDVANPLAAYPDRNWEQVYRDQYRYDSSFTYVCSPNDTHACRLRARSAGGHRHALRLCHGCGGDTGNRSAAMHLPGMTRSARTAGVAVAVVMAALVAVPTAQAVTSADRASAKRAAAWLAGEPPTGMPAGQQADVMVAMRITGTPARALAQRLRAMQRTAPAYADTAGATAKVVLGVLAAGGEVRLRRGLLALMTPTGISLKQTPHLRLSTNRRQR